VIGRELVRARLHGLNSQVREPQPLGRWIPAPVPPPIRLKPFVWQSRRTKRAVVVTLNKLCILIDEVLYRPAVVRVGMRLPRWWNCQLARLSVRLDDRWRVGYWNDESGPAVPGDPCDACGRRAAIHVVGGDDETDTPLDQQEPRSFLAEHPVNLCGWCSLTAAGEIKNESDLRRELKAAAARSTSWRWL
jgi:hypothetical protein